MPKAFTPHEKELIRRRLLEQGGRLFSAYGLKKTSVDELAQAAGISKGAFYLFYDSKEALFMDVIEQIEIRFRRDILAAIDLPGPSPRLRLTAALKTAFKMLEDLPILQFLTGSDYDLLFRRLPPELLQGHLSNDQQFIEELVAHCRETGIPIQVEPQALIGLLYPLVLAILHRDELGWSSSNASIEVLLELAAAYALGEVELSQPGDSRFEP